MKNLFRYFNSSPEVIRLTLMMYIRYPLSLRQLCRISRKRQLPLADLFVAEATARTAADLAGLHRNSAGLSQAARADRLQDC